MGRINLKYVFTFCLIVICSLGRAQDNNYWNQQYGNVSTLLGGAVTGSYNDNGSIYYNPATLAFTDTIKITLSAAIYQSNVLRVSDATRNDTVDANWGFKTFPVAFYPVIRLNAKARLGLIFLPRLFASFNLHDNLNAAKDVTGNGTQQPFIGTFDYRNIMQENWYGLSFSRIVSKRSSVGISVYCSYRYQTMDYNYTATALMNETSKEYLITSINQYLDYDLYQGIVKLGYFRESKNLSFGCALTLPSFYVLSYMRATSQFYFSGWKPYLQSDTLNNLLVYDEEINQRVKHKYPATLSLGLRRKFERLTLFVTTDLYQPIDTYKMLDLNVNENTTIPDDYKESANTILNAETASRFFANVGAGIQIKLKNSKDLVAGISTDFNSLPESFEPVGLNVSTARNNIFHGSVGMDVRIKKIKINGGIKISYGYSRNQNQYVNMSTASTSNLLIGNRQNISDYNYFAFNLLLGFSF